ncbi:MAG: hypothetical protein ACOY5W_17260, partial [Pseudomonadota bacterium]
MQLIHRSPTPAQAVILAEVLAPLPRRLWSAALLTAALWPALPPPERLWAAPLLGLAVLLGGLLGHLAGLLALIAWVRRFPRSLEGIWLAAMLAILALAYLLASLLIAGAAPAEVVDALQAAGGWFPLALLLLFGLPGGLMALRLLTSPQA